MTAFAPRWAATAASTCAATTAGTSCWGNTRGCSRRSEALDDGEFGRPSAFSKFLAGSRRRALGCRNVEIYLDFVLHLDCAAHNADWHNPEIALPQRRRAFVV